MALQGATAGQKETGLSPGDLQRIVDAAQAFAQVQQLVLFGSRAKGNYKPGSDVDLALKGPGISYDVVVQVASRLNHMPGMPYFFDVVDYQTIAEPLLLAHIDRVGLVLWDAEAGQGQAPVTPPHPSPTASA